MNRRTALAVAVVLSVLVPFVWTNSLVGHLALRSYLGEALLVRQRVVLHEILRDVMQMLEDGLDLCPLPRGEIEFLVQHS